MKKNLRSLLCSLAAGAFITAGAQNGIIPNRGCGSDVLPQQFENWLQSLPAQPNHHGIGQNQAQSVFNIPVIVHVIHNNEALNSTTATTGGNLNAAQIQDQINILNADFNARNTDTALIPAAFRPVMGRFQFNFCMAVVNPTGGVLAEPGIDRVNAAATAWSATSPPYARTFVDATIKPATIWDPTRYMNMWVLDINGGILGYATFPNPGTSGLAGLSGPYGTTTTDGLVMLNTAFGSIGTGVSGAPYNLGRTATHEIGHWLGLRHIWGDAGQCGATDYCNDTPPQQGGTASPAGANYGCPTYPLHANTCTLSGQGNPDGDMFMNYMDYTNDACMYMFTNDQKNRAQLIMTNSPMRATLLTSTVCSLPTTTNEVGITYVSSPTYSQVINCNSSISPIVYLQNYGSNVISSATFTYNVDGVNTQTMAWTGTLLPASYAIIGVPQIGGLGNGNHTFNIGVYNPNGGTDPYMLNNVNAQDFSIVNSFAVAVSGNTIICAGQTATLSGGNATNSYTWSPGGVNTNTVALTPSVSTVYTLTAANNTCTATQTVQVVVGGSVSISSSTTALCGGGTVTLTASGASSYTWDSGSNTATVTVSPSVTTTYSVSGDFGGCSANAVITITVDTPPTLTVSANPTTSICVGGSATLSVLGAGSYSWNTGENGSTIVVSPTATAVYTVSGFNSGCLSTETVVANVGTGTISLLLTAYPATVCAGQSVTLTASGATLYTWNTGDSTPTIVVTPTTTSVYAFDGSDGTCLGHLSTTLNITPAPSLTVSMIPSSGTVCLGSTATLSAAGGYTNYTWSTPSVNSSSIMVMPSSTAAVSYTLNSYDVMGGCAVSSVVTVYAATAPVSVLSNTNSACSLPCTGAVSATTTGGTGPYTYSISGSSCTTVPCTNLCPGLYTIHTIDSIGCRTFNVFSISNFASNFVASVSFTNSTCTSCNDGVLQANTFSGLAPFTYSWAPSGGAQATANTLAPGCYTVTITDSVGCMVSASGCVYVVNGIRSNAGNSSFQLYPNPAKENVSIAFEGERFSYAIYDHIGQMIASQDTNSGTVTVSTADLASGIYLVEIDTGKEKLRKKLVIE